MSEAASDYARANAAHRRRLNAIEADYRAEAAKANCGDDLVTVHYNKLKRQEASRLEWECEMALITKRYSQWSQS
jgi:hypothetical protein